MKIKLDENIPLSVQELFHNLGHDTDTARQENLAGVDDELIWRASQQSNRFLITQDLDFSDIRRFTPGTHAGVLVIRLKESGRRSLYQRLLLVFTQEDVESWRGCFVIVSDRKIRVRRP